MDGPEGSGSAFLVSQKGEKQPWIIKICDILPACPLTLAIDTTHQMSPGQQ